ncbi:cell division protein SepF [bacterium]|nr:cell division protein SepF [bacterium]
MALKHESFREKIEFITVEDNEHSLKLADKLLEGATLCLDFTNCPKDQSQRVLDFLSGVNYATDGYVRPVATNKNIFIFALKESFKDPEIKEFLNKFSR